MNLRIVHTTNPVIIRNNSIIFLLRFKQNSTQPNSKQWIAQLTYHTNLHSLPDTNNNNENLSSSINPDKSESPNTEIRNNREKPKNTSRLGMCHSLNRKIGNLKRKKNVQPTQSQQHLSNSKSSGLNYSLERQSKAKAPHSNAAAILIIRSESQLALLYTTTTARRSSISRYIQRPISVSSFARRSCFSLALHTHTSGFDPPISSFTNVFATDYTRSINYHTQ